MTLDQEKIAQWLSDRSPSLHAAYLAALQFLADEAIPGRAQLICHAGRDLCGGLLDVRSVSKRVRADTTSILREIESIWEKEGFDAIGVVETAELTTSPEETASADATIPQPLMLLLQRLMQEHRRAEANQEEQAAELFRENDAASANHPEAVKPAMKEWVRLRRWFHRYAHFGIQQTAPDEQELQEHFALLERFILSVIRTFYENMEGLDEILGEANS